MWYLKELSPLGIENISHIAFAVTDMEAAMREIGDQMGATWAEPRRASPIWMARPGERPVLSPLDVTFSRQGPPFIEILRGPADTSSVFDRTPGPRIHHVGAYAADVAQEADRLVRAGMTLEAFSVPAEQVGDDDPKIQGMAFLSSPYGFRLELVHEVRRAAIAEWVGALPAP